MTTIENNRLITAAQSKNLDIQNCEIITDFESVDFTMQIAGDSMYPKYDAGDILLCKTLKEISFLQWGKPYVITTKSQGRLCKRLLPSKKINYLQAVSDNNKYSPFDIPINDIAGIAIIVGVIQTE